MALISERRIPAVRTTTYLLKAILEQARGAKVGLIGTNQNMIGQEVIPTDRTTPESFEVQRLFREMADAGCAYAVMETSSHALCLDRVYGVHYAVGIFTNLTQDHLDFHVTMENYCDAKAILFRNCGVGVVNGDDPWTPRLLKDATCQVRTYGVKSEADLRAENVVLSANGIAFDAVTKTERVPIRVNIPGGFMVYNTLDVLGAALALGISLKDSAAVLAKVPHVQGRVEVVPTPGKDYTILIDYAHTPDSMVNVLQTVKEFAKGRTVAVFGCGGDRDKTKRPRMGKAAADWSDFAVVTTDNPRTEEPAAIIRDILPGFDGSNTPYEVVEDRVEGKDLPFVLADNPSLWRGGPRKVAFRYIVSDYHQEMKDLMRQGREVRPLFYHKDRPLLRTLRMEKNLLGHFQKFKRYYQRKS